MISADLAHSGVVLSDADLQAIRNNGSIVRLGMKISVEKDLVRIATLQATDMAGLIFALLVCEEVIRIHGHFYMLAINAEGASAMPADQRRLGAQWSRKNPSRGTAIVNHGNRVTNTMTSLLIRAVNTMISRPIPLAFFGSESEARVWLQSLREPQP